LRLLALGRAMLAQNLAGKALRDGELHHDMVDAAATAGGAQMGYSGFSLAKASVARRD
jgi:hypothetical protein